MRWQVLPVSVVQIEKELDRSVTTHSTTPSVTRVLPALSLGKPRLASTFICSPSFLQLSPCLWQVLESVRRENGKLNKKTRPFIDDGWTKIASI